MIAALRCSRLCLIESRPGAGVHARALWGAQQYLDPGRGGLGVKGGGVFRIRSRIRWRNSQAARPGASAVLCHQVPVPRQQRGRRHDPVRTQLLGQQPVQRREQCAVTPGRPRRTDLAARHRYLVAQDQDGNVAKKPAVLTPISLPSSRSDAHSKIHRLRPYPATARRSHP